MKRSTKNRSLAAAGVVVGVLGVTVGLMRDNPVEQSVPAAVAKEVAIVGELHYERIDNRTVVRDSAGTVAATLTDNARSVNVIGPSRTFAEEPNTDAQVTSRTWVRLLPQPWAPGAETQPWFRPWLDQQLHNTDPDVLAVATEYLPGRPDALDPNGIRIGGDAGYGPPGPGGDPTSNSDFYDYLGTPFTFPDGAQARPEPHRFADVDSAGFLRLVLGYRMGVPMSNSNDPGAALPRRTDAIAASGPGAAVTPDQAKPVSDFRNLQPGDLVFFDFDADRRMDHGGIYLGLDDDGHRRFVSSRSTADGPTMGDTGGTSLLDDGGYYARGFRAVKRL